MFSFLCLCTAKLTQISPKSKIIAEQLKDISKNIFRIGLGYLSRISFAKISFQSSLFVEISSLVFFSLFQLRLLFVIGTVKHNIWTISVITFVPCKRRYEEKINDLVQSLWFLWKVRVLFRVDMYLWSEYTGFCGRNDCALLKYITVLLHYVLNRYRRKSAACVFTLQPYCLAISQATAGEVVCNRKSKRLRAKSQGADFRRYRFNFLIAHRKVKRIGKSF